MALHAVRMNKQRYSEHVLLIWTGVIFGFRIRHMDETMH